MTISPVIWPYLKAFLQGWTGAFGGGLGALYGVAGTIPSDLPRVTLSMIGALAVASCGAGFIAVHNRLAEPPKN